MEFHSGIENTSITIIGLGGVGSSVALQLCKLGFLDFYLYDGDVVEIDNLFKCLAYDEKSIGENKALCLANKLREINNHVVIEATPNYFLNSATNLETSQRRKNHVIVQCGDKESIKVLQKIRSEFGGTNTTVVTAGCFEQFVTSGPTLRMSDLENYLNLVLKEKSQELSEKIDSYNHTVINVGMINSVLMAASLIVNEIINCIYLGVPSLLNLQMRLHLQTLESEKISL
jgi:ThiF family